MVNEQLELEWQVPPATPAVSDLVCWLWAAFPPREGKLNVSRISRALGVPATTMRRWITKNDPSKLAGPTVRRIHQRAILRGRGHYLWPDLDQVSRRRAAMLYSAAISNVELIETEPDRIPPEWRRNGTLEPHQVHLVHFRRAHVYGVASTRHPKALAKIRRFGTILDTQIVGNKYAGVVLKHQMLDLVEEHRCVVPRELVPTGRTETWRETGGPVDIPGHVADST